MTTPPSPSTMTMSPSSTSIVTLVQPTTAGNPSALARIEVCPVSPPPSVANATMWARCNSTVWLGVSSCAMTMTGPLTPLNRSVVRPLKCESTRRSRSMTSAAFCTNISFPIARSRSASFLKFSATAYSAITDSRWISSRMGWMRVGSDRSSR